MILSRGIVLRHKFRGYYVDVCLESRDGQYWNCIVVGSCHPTYKVGGEDLHMHADTLRTSLPLLIEEGKS